MSSPRLLRLRSPDQAYRSAAVQAARPLGGGPDLGYRAASGSPEDLAGQGAPPHDGAPWPRDAAAAPERRGWEAEARRLAEWRARLAASLGGADPEAVADALDLLEAQAREIWALRLAAAGADSGAALVAGAAPEPRSSIRASGPPERREVPARAACGGGELVGARAAEMSALFNEVAAAQAQADAAREAERGAAHLCSELAEEAELIAARTAGAVEAGGRWRRALEAEAARCELLEQSSTELRAEALRGKELRAEVSRMQERAAAEAWGWRTEADEFRQECAELRATLRRMEDAASRAASEPPAAPVGRQGRPGSDAAGDELHLPAPRSAEPERIPWHNPEAVFAAFASAGPAGERAMRPADFGHLCESLRRAQGRGATPAEHRRGFALFAFAAVFGRQALEVDAARFALLFGPLAGNLEELERAHVERTA